MPGILSPRHVFTRGPNMATYEYRCRSCHATFSVRERMSEYDAAHAVCPQCKSRDVERVLSEFYARTPRKS